MQTGKYDSYTVIQTVNRNGPKCWIYPETLNQIL